MGLLSRQAGFHAVEVAQRAPGLGGAAVVAGFLVELGRAPQLPQAGQQPGGGPQPTALPFGQRVAVGPSSQGRGSVQLRLSQLKRRLLGVGFRQLAQTLEHGRQRGHHIFQWQSGGRGD